MNLIELSNNKCIKRTFLENSLYEFTYFENILPESIFREMKKAIINILRNSSMKKYENTKINLPSVYYGHSNNGDHPFFVPFWSCTLTDMEFFNTTIMNYLEKHMNKKFYVKRIYTSFQSMKQIGNWHIDDSDENSTTFTMYVDITKDDMKINTNPYNDINFNKFDKQYGGEFHIKIPEESFVRFFECKENNGLFFPSFVHHYGNCFGNFSTNCIRCVVAYKLYVIET